MRRRVWPLPRVDRLAVARLEEKRSVGLITDDRVWQAVGGELAIDFVSRQNVEHATLEHWRELARGFEGEMVYALGGGLVVDAAKLVSAERDLPLVSVPTALSVDAFFTWASGYRSQGCVRYLETRPPDRVVLDLDLLAAAPAGVRAAGLCDVLSIATGCFDWRYAEKRGENPDSQRYLAWAAEVARALLGEAIACAGAAGAGEPQGLERLADLLALEVQLCNQLGHSRPEEGSEHYFAYALENHVEKRAGEGLPHGDLVGPGIVLMARLQGQDETPLRDALLAGGIPLGIESQPAARDTLLELQEYSTRHELPFGRAHTLERDEIDALF